MQRYLAICGIGVALCIVLSCCDNYPNEAPGNYELTVVEARGVVIPNDSLTQPKSVLALNTNTAPVRKYLIDPTPTNVLPVINPKVRTAGAPRVIKTGPGGELLIKTVPAIEHPVLKGLPTVLSARETYGVDPNPQNFSSFSKLQGLRGGSINSIIEDKRGNLWFGTLGSGIVCYDGQSFTVFTKNEGLSDNRAGSLHEDLEGNLWFSWGGGITRYDGKYFTHFTKEEGLNGNHVSSISGDSKGNVWIGTHDGGIAKYDGESFTQLIVNDGLNLNNILDIFEDRSGNMWFATHGAGVLKYNEKELLNFTSREGLIHDVVTCITQDSSGGMWFGTKEGGISRYNGTSFTNFTAKEGIPSDLVLSIMGDSEGNVWFGTQPGGVTKYDGQHFEHFSVIEGLRENRIRSMYEDSGGNIWFATDDDGISKYVNRGVRQYAKKGRLNYIIHGFVHDQSGTLWMSTQKSGIASFDGDRFTVVTKDAPGYSMHATRILKDRNNNIWFGSWGGLTKYDGRTFTHFTDREGLSVNRIYCIAEDKAGNLWIGTDLWGVSKYDGENFTHYSTKEGLSHNIVYAITEDRAGTLWFATLGGGVTSYDGTTFTHFTEASGLSNNVVLSIEEDHSGNLWFGTGGGGVTKYDGKYFTHFTEREGLSSNSVGSILEDSSGDIWFGTKQGLSKLTAARLTEITEKNSLHTLNESEASTMIFTYDEGMLGNAVGGRVIFEDNDGNIWVAADDRLNVFHPAELRADTAAPELHLTDVSLFNESINWGTLLKNKDSTFTLGNGVKLKHFELSGTVNWQNVPEDLSLAYNNDNLTFNYAGLNLQAPQAVKYQYQLDGLEENWNALTTHNAANYSNLLPGKYTFKVKAKSGGGIWSNELHYPFTIRPPWWQTWWAYLLYSLLIGGSLYVVYSFELKQRLQRAEAIRLKELDVVKTRLYTNITHEFRTPLTVILGMAEQVLEDPEEYFRDGLNMIIGQGQHILLLVDQMLDLSKLESHKLTLHWQQGDVIPFLLYVAESFHSLADTKDIQIHFFADTESVIMDYDEVRLQQVISNLLSNAIKFTPEGGHVYLFTSVMDGSFILKVKDTGIGIAKADLAHVFDRFFQSDSSSTRQGEGTGIGLALTRELVTLMEGRISVKSHQGRGAEFEVKLPINSAANVKVEPGEVSVASDTVTLKKSALSEVGYVPEVKKVILAKKGKTKVKPLVLIADDNADVRTYLAACLTKDYKLALAKNGQECEEMALKIIPDLIVLDVMMPLKNGFDTCISLKTDERTSHIPIIMLTAKADMDSKLEGLQQGADDYLTKPFHKQELLLRIRKLLELRRQLQKYYRSLLELDGSSTSNAERSALSKETKKTAGHVAPEDLQSDGQSIPLTGSSDNAFVMKVRKSVETHLDDAQFTVAVLCRSLALSHSQVHRKLSALTGLSATHFIRYVRLLKAKELLRDSGFSVAAIASDCGFGDPAYFSRVFKQEFGVSPQLWREENAARD